MLPIIPIAIAAGVIAVAGAVFMAQLKTISEKEGYEKASKVFKEKFEKQYDDFMSETKTWENNRKEYEDLVKAYKEYAEELRRENEDLKKNGTSAASATAAATLGLSIISYRGGLEKEIAYFDKCIENLKKLKKA